MGDYIFGPPPPPPPRANGPFNFVLQPNGSGSKKQQQSAVRSGRGSVVNGLQQGMTGYSGQIQRPPVQYQYQSAPLYNTPYAHQQQYQPPNYMQYQQPYQSPQPTTQTYIPYGQQYQQQAYQQSYSQQQSYQQQQQYQSYATINSYNPVAYSYSALTTQQLVRPTRQTAKHDEELEEGEAGADGVVKFRGTTIALKTDEDIENWINERKRNWPSARRIQEKAEEKIKPVTAHNALDRQKDSRRVCKFFTRKGKCSRGTACKFRHETTAQKSRHSVCDYKRYQKPQRMPLFKRLVQNDWDKENDKALDFIEYLVNSGVVSRSKAVVTK
ncbi:hypothetical protein V1512DRAFT_260928 [Lipomyces arxii]|uniref:uncharacterized protein n=1 Tax=Lipomyces arxii TaxID=56418 RepID=UPI0034CEED76